MRTQISILILLLSLVSWKCSRRNDGKTDYTQEDFITASYLDYQDSLVHAWNLMINDDNEKLAALHQLLAELRTVDQENKAQLIRYENRLEQLHRIRYTQKSMSNADVIEEYDFASTTLVREILATAELSGAFTDNTVLQQLVDQIRMAEERVENYRADYDDLVAHYNTFLETNKTYLGQMSRDSLAKKPRFELVSIE
jgi:hypothetical protein